jgi:hypothetical protein
MSALDRSAWISVALVAVLTGAWLLPSVSELHVQSVPMPARLMTERTSQAAPLGRIEVERGVASAPSLDREAVAPRVTTKAPRPIDVLPAREVGPGRVRVSGLLLDERGAPLRKRRVGLSLHASPPTDAAFGSVWTDTDGRFALLVDWDSIHSAPTVEIRSGSLSTARSATVELPPIVGDSLALGSITLSVPTPIPTVSLGEITLRRVGPMLSGRVLHSDGRAFAGAQVEMLTPTRLYSLCEPCAPSASSNVSDQDGRFEVFGFELPGRDRTEPMVLVVGDKCGPEPRQRFGPFLERTADLELVVQPICNARVRCRILLDPEIELGLIEAALERADETFAPATSIERGSVEFGRQAVGRYDFVVRSAHSDSVVFRAENIELAPNGECSDTRLATIDLRKRFDWIYLSVRTPDGAIAANRRFHVFLEGYGAGEVAIDALGNAAILVPRGTESVLVRTAPGQLITLRDGDTLVTDRFRDPPR